MLVLSVFLTVLSAHSQQKSEWKQAFARADGALIYQGVEILYTTGICENRSAVFVKMINHNDYAVNVEWRDQVMDKNYEWHNNTVQTAGQRKSISLNANETLEGQCGGGGPELVVYINEFVSSYDKFSYYRTSSPTVNKSGK